MLQSKYLTEVELKDFGFKSLGRNVRISTDARVYSPENISIGNNVRIDDKIDDLHYYTTHIKFGLGRASYDASQEIRNNHLTREEGVALVRQFDGETPEHYLQEVLDYIDLDLEEFMDLCDQFRSPHLWGKVNGEWKLKHHVWDVEI